MSDQIPDDVIPLREAMRVPPFHSDKTLRRWIHIGYLQGYRFGPKPAGDADNRPWYVSRADLALDRLLEPVA
jgi:hypothetical protein